MAMADVTAPDATRARLLAAARRQFAERGFYGASIAQIAGEVGLTKQALLYHFKRKEDLYAEVLKGIAGRLVSVLDAAADQGLPAEQELSEMLLGVHAASQADPRDTRILMRELLDNQVRAPQANDWFLKTFLDRICATFRRIEGLKNLSFAQAFIHIYQVLGSIEYFAISRPTLEQMYGTDGYARFQNGFPRVLRGQIARMIASARAT